MDKSTSWMSLSKRVLGFATTYGPEDEDDPPSKKASIARDRLTHRVIEKKRRDRMNNCLADLSQLIPPRYLKQGQGRIEKTEVIEKAIKHIEYLQQLADESRHAIGRSRESYKRGFKACQEIVIEFLVEIECSTFDDSVCSRLVQMMQAKACELPDDIKKEDDMHIQQDVHQRFGSVTDAVLYRRHSDETTREPWRDLDETKLSPQEMCDPTRPESGYVSDYVTDPRLQTSAATQNEIVSDDDSDEMMSLNPVRCSPTQDGQSNGGGYKFKNHIQHRYTVKDTIVSQTARPIPPPSSSLSSSLSSLSTLSSHYLPPENSSVGLDPARNEQTSSPGRCRNVTDSHEKPYSSGKILKEPSGVMPPLIGIDQGAVHAADRVSEVVSSGQHASRNGAVMTRPKTVADDTDNVPGFALHPSGSFYLPVVVLSEAVAAAMLNYSSMGLCHPVSINVRFGVPKPLDGATERHAHRTTDGASTVAPQRSSEGSREISLCPTDDRRMFPTQCNSAQRNAWGQRYITTG